MKIRNRDTLSESEGERERGEMILNVDVKDKVKSPFQL